MDAHEYEVMYHAEECHWWYRGIAAIMQVVIHRQIKPVVSLQILDTGCGTGGAMVSDPAGYGTVTGVDNSPLALGFCQKRSLQRIVQASVEALPFRKECFDLVTCLDVLYEQAVLSDVQAVEEAARLLVPGGYIFL